MSKTKSLYGRLSALGIAALFLGYFASYIPFTMLTKMSTKGLFEGMNGFGFTGLEIQPMASIAILIVMFTFVTLAGWWKYATHSQIFGISVPRPQWFTVVSGLCTIAQILTVTLAFTFTGISIVFAVLLMKGGVLAVAPIVDALSKKRKRKIFWPSWLAAGFAFLALLVAFMEHGGTTITMVCLVDILIYLFAYSFKLWFMSTFAKSSDEEEKKRYFVEEQLVASPLLLLGLFLIAMFGSKSDPSSVASQFWNGFVNLPHSGYLLHVFAIGAFSCGAGLFGNLMYLDKRENTFCVAVNRSASILAGIMATYLLAIFWGQGYPSVHKMIGALMIIGSILFLVYHGVVVKKKAAPKLQKSTK